MISENFYQNSLARHPVNFFSNYFDSLVQKYNQREGSPHKINNLSKNIFKIIGLVLDVITAPIRLPLKAVGMIYSNFFNKIAQVEGLID